MLGIQKINVYVSYVSRSQTIYGSLVETYGPYLQDYTKVLNSVLS